MPSDNTRITIDDYIRKRHEALERLAAVDSDKELHAQISFNGYLTSDQLVALIKENKLNPLTLNIGWKDNSGGYDLQRNESIEAAVESAALHHARFIAQLREDADTQVGNPRQQGVHGDQIKSALAFQNNVNELTSVFNKKGISFYGVRVSASAIQLQSLTRNDREIRLIDPLWGGAVEAEITNAYPTTKIAIPLIPDKEIFLP